MPKDFTIFPPPDDLSSWIELLAQNVTQKTESLKKPEKSKLGLSTNGNNFLAHVEYKTLLSWTSIEWKRVRQSMRSRSPYEIMNLAKQLNLPLEEKQLLPPSIMWHRPSENITKATQQKMKTDKNSFPYQE